MLVDLDSKSRGGPCMHKKCGIIALCRDPPTHHLDFGRVDISLDGSGWVSKLGMDVTHVCNLFPVLIHISTASCVCELTCVYQNLCDWHFFIVHKALWGEPTTRDRGVIALQDTM